ncbi:alkanesulfonate monooxygenase SsuD/methylene tetrahydromethanopterin reductase-like flavin-dependent oxidoreductase (luciferase family) [Rhodoligotrophos appendicifer]|uniref:LLM class flavin-dependent oxidoreductase n=1 Tax=Rhodoligotrophos appendicifer TaxID=987056 RepID=UPI0011861C46|nr:LLM class flavin-dependent oxidoreductase [Rhodoligotrophos appendicifer]
MKFSISLTMERTSPSTDMRDVIHHMVEMTQLAEEMGFDIVWVGEHHTIETNIGAAPFQLLTHLANHTDRIRLGTACVVAPYWHPIKLAGEAATFDHLSGGRLELGIGRGAYQYEFDRMAGGIPQKQGGEFMQELVPLLRSLWAGDTEAHGKFWSFPTSTSVPKPLQRQIPIWIAARDPATYDWALSQGLNIHSWPITRPFSELESYRQRFLDALAKNPQNGSPQFLAMRHVAVYDKPDGWRLPVETVRDRNGFFESLFRNLGGVKNGFPDQINIHTLAHNAEFTPESLRQNLVFGQPHEVVDKLRLYEEAGVDNFCYFASYGLPYDFQKRSLELFGREVIPAFAKERVSVVA